jgi:spermidine synthase
VKPYVRLAEARTPKGSTLALYRHDGAYLIRADGVELMSTRRHFSEDRLAELACAPFRDKTEARVLIGGLGLGFTMRAALQQLNSSARVVVAELLPEVIEWNANPEYGISTESMRDPRVEMVQDDVVNVLKNNRGGFDAIMLDTDNGPDGMLLSENAPLYTARGITTTIAALRPGGVIAYWSVADDHKFARSLKHVGLEPEIVRVRAHETSGPIHTLYIVATQPPAAT